MVIADGVVRWQEASWAGLGFFHKVGGHHHVADAVDLAVQLVILAIQEPLDNRFGAHLEYQ